MTKMQCLKFDWTLILSTIFSESCVTIEYLLTMYGLWYVAKHYRELFRNSPIFDHLDVALFGASIFFFGCALTHFLNIVRMFSGEPWVLWMQQAVAYIQVPSWIAFAWFIHKRRRALGEWAEMVIKFRSSGARNGA